MQTNLGLTCEKALTSRSLPHHVIEVLLQVKEVPEYRTHPFFLLVFISGIVFSFDCWSFICNSFAICFHMVVDVLKKILVCVGECE